MSVRFLNDSLSSGGAGNKSTAGRYLRLNYCFATANLQMEVPNVLTVRADAGPWMKLREFDVIDFGKNITMLQYQLFAAPNVVTVTNTVDVEMMISDEPLLPSIVLAPRRLYYPALTGNVAGGAAKITSVVPAIQSVNGLNIRGIIRRIAIQNNTSVQWAIVGNHNAALSQAYILPVGGGWDEEVGENVQIINLGGGPAALAVNGFVEWI